MPSISTSQARPLFTIKVVDAYREMATPLSFLRSFFKADESFTLDVAIDVERNGEKVAVDVHRASEGNRNTFSKTTMKTIEPPYYREFFDNTQLKLYQTLFGSDTISDGMFSQFVKEVATRYKQLQNIIERSYERQCAQVLQTGVVTLASGDNIDFKRKAQSLVDKGAGNYWDSTTVDPNVDIENACTFIRQAGKSQGGTFNAIFGSKAWNAYLNNTIIKERNNLKAWKLDNIVPSIRNSVGGVLHGQVDCGSYTVNLWTYPEFYEDASGNMVPYVAPENVIVLPEVPRFTLAYAAVPQVLPAGFNNPDFVLPAPKAGAFVLGDYIDQRATAHIFDIKSAGIAIPTAVDQISTTKVVGG